MNTSRQIQYTNSSSKIVHDCPQGGEFWNALGVAYSALVIGIDKGILGIL